MKSLHQHIEERLIVNKDYKNVENSLLELAKKIGSVSQNIKGRITKNTLRNDLIFFLHSGHVIVTLYDFEDEILNNINKYDKRYLLIYHKYGTDGTDKNKTLKEIITQANEEDKSELLFQSNPRAPKNNVQIIRIKDDDVLIYVVGKSLFKKGKFDVEKIESFNIIIMYND